VHIRRYIGVKIVYEHKYDTSTCTRTYNLLLASTLVVVQLIITMLEYIQ
jgi:hypothetical protein